MKSKIGIMTLHDSINFGAFLQAFALQTILENHGYDAKFIVIEKNRFLSRFKMVKAKNPKWMYFKYRSLKKFDTAKKKLHFSHENINHYNAIIVGSDEVWNLENPSFTHREEFFGKNISVKNIISYAPSCNNLTADRFKEITNGKIDFSSFNKISVRDDNTKKLVHDISNIEATLVLDPTLLIDSYEEYIIPCLKDNFILIYGYKFSEDEKRKIKEFSLEKNKKLISIGLYNSWCDENIYASPFEFLGYLKAADYVITSTFHGTIFAILMKTHFVTFGRNNHKVLDILNKLSVTERNISNVNKISTIIDQPINYEKINKLRKSQAETSIDFLINALKSKGE